MEKRKTVAVPKNECLDQKEIGKIVDNMSLFDDDLMSRVFDNNKPATEYLLKTILGRNVHVKETKGQVELKNPVVGGRNIRLDIVASDDRKRKFNCEVQRDNRGTHPQRARFHSSMLDTRMLKEKELFQNLKDSYVIFITEKDYFKLGKPVYRIERMLDVNGESFGDGSHIIYVNGAYKGEDEIGHLMEDFHNRGTDGFHNQELRKGVIHFKVEEEGRKIMCEAVEKYAKKKYSQGVRQGIEQGIEQGIREERARNEAEIAALKAQIESLKKSAATG